MPAEGRRADESYLFGDTGLAAERLRLLAEVFAASTRSFLKRFVRLAPRRILDLGCGPGHTTRLLAEIFPQAQVRGVDSSANFVGLAGATPDDRVDYQVADVTHTVPAGPYDLIYCRYLLTHVTHPQAAIALWGEQLAPQGWITIEENDWIRTAQPALAKYLRIVEAMLAERGQRLYVGARLDGLETGPALAKSASEVVPVAVRDSDAARMFVMNLDSWRHQTFIERNHPAAELDLLRRDLEQLAEGDPRQSSITFGLRQIVLERG